MVEQRRMSDSPSRSGHGCRPTSPSRPGASRRHCRGQERVAVTVAARNESPSSARLTPVVATVFCASPRRRRERRRLTSSWTPAPAPPGGATRSRSRARGEVGEKRRPLVCIGYRPDTGVNEKTSVKLTAQKRHAKHQRQAHPFLFYRGIFYRCIGP